MIDFDREACGELRLNNPHLRTFPLSDGSKFNPIKSPWLAVMVFVPTLIDSTLSPPEAVHRYIDLATTQYLFRHRRSSP